MFKSENLKNNKFWAIIRNAKTTIVKFGRMGTKARQKIKEHANEKAAKKFFDSKVDEKKKKGYTTYNEDDLNEK